MAFVLPDGLTPTSLVLLAVILALSALMSGLSGFGFSAIGALSLWLLPPKLGVPLLMSLSSANQLMSIGQLKADLKPLKQWWPDGPGPYLAGGLLGAPVGLAILHALPTGVLMAVFGGFLVLYAGYSIFKPASMGLKGAAQWPASAVVGFSGGVIGGFTAFPGAAVVVWSGLRKLSKTESRAIVQPYIFAMQILSLAILAIQHPETFGPAYWSLLLMTLPVVLPGTLLGVRPYMSPSNVNFRRVTFMLLGTSGFGLLVKAAGPLIALAGVARLAAH